MNGFGDSLSRFGLSLVRYSIVLVLVWIGAMKFTNYEATAIQGLITPSPLVNWLYDVTSVQGASNLIGAIEILTAIALVIGARSAAVGVIGALMAVGTFALTLTFLVTTPGWEATLGGFPALSVVPGQFVLKDVVLLAGSIYLLGDAMQRASDMR